MKEIFRQNRPDTKHINFLSFSPKDFFDDKAKDKEERLPEVVVLTTYPPRQCGIATYSEDLIKALEKQYVNSFDISVCALETDKEQHEYGPRVKYTLNTSRTHSYAALLSKINNDVNIKVVLIQHEFGLFHETKEAFNNFISLIKKPVVIVFHTVLPRPDEEFRQGVQHLLDHVDGIIVMTDGASEILCRDYAVDAAKISVIAHGTHLVAHLDKNELKRKYGLYGKRVLSTFGLLSAGKNIETTLRALPSVVNTTPDAHFLIIGKTHPTVALNEGERYREHLQSIIDELGISEHVSFVNKYLPLDELLEYLQMTDIYVFSSNDPNQAVSGTFSYALSCGCSVVSTPIPHAKEVLKDGSGFLFDFGNSEQLAGCINQLLFDENLRRETVISGLHKITATAWENSAVAHAKVLREISGGAIQLRYRNPELNLAHIKKMTTGFGMLQFSKINDPDIESGYTIDDNARALIALCQHYKLTREDSDLRYIKIYLDFIAYCERRGDLFINYVDYNQNFTDQNEEVNLEDSSGRAIWALGYLVSLSYILPPAMVKKAQHILDRVLPVTENIHSPRAMAFICKGLYYSGRTENSKEEKLMRTFADRLVKMYQHEASPDWLWFESYLTYGNSVLPEALLCAYAITGESEYKTIARQSFDFLLDKTFTDNAIKVISNRSWHLKGQECDNYGEQPIDVAYTILTLRKFYDIFKDKEYLKKMEIAFNWFLGNNHLGQIIYNPCTGGCFDGLEEHNVNLNQGAESTVSYLMARLTCYKYFGSDHNVYQMRKNRVLNLA